MPRGKLIVAVARPNKPKTRQRRRRPRRANALKPAPLPAIQYISSKPITTATRMYSAASAKVNLSRVSKPGLDWLKCAFAAPDFPGLTPVGIPDDYTGRTLVKQFRYDSTFIVSPDENGEQYVIVPPVPGCAFFTPNSTPSAATEWRATTYSDAPTIFGSHGTKDDAVTSFRYMSQLVELVPTTNAMTWTGSIEVYKIPLRITDYQGAHVVGPTNYYSTFNTVTGLQAVESTNCDRFSTPSNLGVFANATSDQCDFEFSNCHYYGYSVPYVSSVASPADSAYSANKYGSLVNTSFFGIPGFGNLDTVVIKLSGVTASNTFRIKTWATMEFTVNNNNALYEYSIMSPLADPYALEAYRAFVRACPVAVTYYENGKFWDFIRKAATAVSGALSFVPGPVGAIAGGVNQLVRPRRQR